MPVSLTQVTAWLDICKNVHNGRTWSTVRNVKIALFENIVLLFHPHVDVPYTTTVWLLRNLSLDGELCLRDGKNVAFV